MTVAGLSSKEARVKQLRLLRYMRSGSFGLCRQSKPAQCMRWHLPVGFVSMLALLEMIPELSNMHVCCR